MVRKLVIREIELVNHGPFRGRHVFHLPSEGLGVLVAPNEFGKTTLLTAIGDILWGTRDPRRNWLADLAEPHRGTIDFEWSGEDGIRRYTVTRDFDASWVTCTEVCRDEANIVFDGRHNPSGRTRSNRLWSDDHLPTIWVPMTQDAFQHICMIQQPPPERINQQLLQQLVVGRGDVTAREAQERLVERFRAISKFS